MLAQSNSWLPPQCAPNIWWQGSRERRYSTEAGGKNTGDKHACLFSLFLQNNTVFKITANKIIFNAVGSPFGDPCGKTCLEERDNQWLGVTLSRQPGENGSIVVGCWESSLITSWNQIPWVRLSHHLVYFYVLFRLVGIDGKIYFT